MATKVISLTSKPGINAWPISLKCQTKPHSLYRLNIFFSAYQGLMMDQAQLAPVIMKASQKAADKEVQSRSTIENL